MYCTDRQIIERMLLPAMMQAIIKAIRHGLDDSFAELDAIDELLARVIQEPLEELPPDRITKLVRRAKRITQEALTILDGQVIGTQYLAIAYFTSSLAERGVITVGAESAFSQAWDKMSALLSGMNTLSSADISENSAKMLEKYFIKTGYYLH